ncbi:hypothetical protein [Glutamicibacter soli]
MSVHDYPDCTHSTDSTEQFNEFRRGNRRSLTAQPDLMFKLTEMLLCVHGKVTDLTHLSLEPEHRHDYRALYDAINHG